MAETMLEVPLEGGPVEIVGALELRRSPTGLSPRRLPAWTAPQIPDAFMDMIVQMTLPSSADNGYENATVNFDFLFEAIQRTGVNR